MSHDVVAIGEAMIRLSVPPGRRLEEAPELRVHIGGAEANTAVAVARMGSSAAWVTRLPDTPLGRRAAAEVGRHGVDVSHVAWTDEDRMGLYFVELGTPPRPTSVVYDRAGSAASRMTSSDVPWHVVEGAAVVHLSGITPALGAGCRLVTLEAKRRVQQAGGLVSFDVNYRSKLWTGEEARETLGEVAHGVDVLISTLEDARDVFGVEASPADVAAALSDLLAVGRVVVTAGASGAAWLDGGQSGFSKGFEATVIDRVGAGDAFAAGVLLGLLDGDLPGGVRRGQAMAALEVGIEGDHFIAGPADVDAVLSAGTRRVDR